MPKQRGCLCHMGRWVPAKASLGCQILTDHEHRWREVGSRSLKGLTRTESSSAQGWVVLVPCDRELRLPCCAQQALVLLARIMKLRH